MNMGNVNTLLFDLGGVLIELGPITELMAASSMNPERIWENWSHSASVRQYESGECSDESFARNMISEFDMGISPHQFLDLFRVWPRGAIPGAADLLERLAGNYRLACLSNTNNIHYETLISRDPLMRHFHSVFLSHQTGYLKPEPEAFRHVISELGVQPDEVLFFDDNRHNITTALQLGFHAVHVKSLNDVIHGLSTLSGSR